MQCVVEADPSCEHGEVYDRIARATKGDSMILNLAVFVLVEPWFCHSADQQNLVRYGKDSAGQFVRGRARVCRTIHLDDA